jgi:hypothetical protein
MNWNEIEHIVHENQIDFNDQEPNPDHIKRFENRLHEKFGKRTSSERHLYMKIAAAVAFLVVSSSIMMFTYFHLRYTPSQPAIITQAVIEFGETEEYYSGQIKIGMDQLGKLQLPEIKQKEIILSELAAMDENYNQLKRDLKANPADERVIHAIIEHYQVKLDAINQIINSVSYSQMQIKQQSNGQDI